MSAPREQEKAVETDDVGSLGELLPKPLQPLWRPVERIQAFRHTHSDTYVTALEVIIAIVLIGGYLYWLFLFFVM